MTSETNKSELAKRLSQIIMVSGEDKKVFAKKCGMSANQIYNYLNGSQEPSTKFYRNLKIRYPSINIDWLISGQGSPTINEKGVCDSIAEYGSADIIGANEAKTPKNVFDLQHEQVIRGFDDKEFAIEINAALVALEKASMREFYKLGGYIKAVAEQKTEKSQDRRKSERRQKNDPTGAPNGEDRRRGNDRRRTGT